MAKFLSKTEDDSTDISATEQSLWFARLVTEGTVRTEFLGCVLIHKTNAGGIVASSDKTLENNLFMPLDTLMKKVAWVTIDGANVMVGKSPGVNVRLQKCSPWILILHCMAHRLELAYKDTSNNIILYQKAVAGLAFGLYKFYVNSPLNQANLKRAAAVIESEAELQQHLNVQGSRDNKWGISYCELTTEILKSIDISKNNTTSNKDSIF